ncbi:DUF6544 family protein [Streptomyces sp. HUAS ZL42]|uniref:DUF6544 family protein n=1 Tax=Streptomyces sp. HUAS ZL42 TaxID=3231715 RepID=UPI00345EE715
MSGARGGASRDRHAGHPPEPKKDRLYTALMEEVAAAGLPSGHPPAAVLTDADLAGLPDAVQRYLRFMDIVGRPRIWSFRARFVGRFRLRPGARWAAAEAWQYNSAVEIARLFAMRIRFAHLIPVLGHDTYVRGHGRLLVKLMGRIPVSDGSGEEFDISELITYLNDAVLLAPSMLLGPATSWAQVDDHAFDVTLTEGAHAVTARVFLDQRGAPVDFHADRYATLPGGLVLAPWRTPVTRWDIVPGRRPLPGPATAVYDLPDGPFPYIEGRFVPGSLAYNIAPGCSRRSA